MKKHILFLLAAIVLLLTNCVKSNEGGEDPQPPTPPQEQIIIPSTVDVKPVVSPEGGENKIKFTAAAAWKASVISTKADSWIDVNPKSGNPGSAEITITTTPNDTYVERNATIQISCGEMTIDIVVTQKQLDNITVTTDKVELGVGGGSFTIGLKTNIDFNYEIEGDWIKYVSTRAYADKTLTFSAEPNDGVQKREGSVTVKGGEFSETVKVYQSGEEPTLVITQNEYEVEAEGGSITVEVSSNVAVKMTIPENAGWITENETKSVSTSTFHLDIASNGTTAARSAEITFSNEESGLSENITINQKGKIYVPVTDMVDLGLSVKWATCNIGANKPEEYGGYYQWAGIQDVTNTAINLGFDNCPYHTPGTDYSIGWTKYVQSDKSASWAGTGNPDNKTVLDPEDDIAYVTLGDKWRMPTDAEWTELRENCTWTWTDNYNGTGVAGRIVTSNITGYTDKSIFLPAAGYRDELSLLSTGINGCYWSSSLESGCPYLAYWVLSYSSNVRRQNCYRFYGNSVRPVYGDRASTTETVNFPDEAFRNYMIQNYDLNNDGAVSLNEASKVEVIQIETTDIESLSGIEYCPELKFLSCVGRGPIEKGNLKSVDVSKNPKLEYLNLSYNRLESLDVSNNVNLISLYCSENNLSVLDLSKCTELATYEGQGIETINISNTKLEDNCHISGASKIVAKNCKSMNQLIFFVTSSNCTIDTDIPVATFSAYSDINTTINFGSSKVDNVFISSFAKGTGYKATMTVKSENAFYMEFRGAEAPQTLSLGNGNIDYVPKLKELYLYGLPFEVRYSKKKENDLYIGHTTPNYRDVYVAKSKLIDFGPYVPVSKGYLWKYVKATPIFVNTYTKSISNALYTTEAKETNWTPQKDGYEWYPVSGVDFDFETGDYNPPTPENSLVGTSWTCSTSDVAKYNTLYSDITLTFNSQSSFSMNTVETIVYKSYDYNGDGNKDQGDYPYVDGVREQRSHTQNGTYTLNGTSLKLVISSYSYSGTINGNSLTIQADGVLKFQKQ